MDSQNDRRSAAASREIKGIFPLLYSSATGYRSEARLLRPHLKDLLRADDRACADLLGEVDARLKLYPFASDSPIEIDGREAKPLEHLRILLATEAGSKGAKAAAAAAKVSASPPPARPPLHRWHRAPPARRCIDGIGPRPLALTLPADLQGDSQGGGRHPQGPGRVSGGGACGSWWQRRWRRLLPHTASIWGPRGTPPPGRGAAPHREREREKAASEGDPGPSPERPVRPGVVRRIQSARAACQGKAAAPLARRALPSGAESSRLAAGSGSGGGERQLQLAPGGGARDVAAAR